MTSPASELAPRARMPGYLILGLMVVAPLVDLLVSGWPVHPNSPSWRFGFLLAGSSAIFLPLMALFLIHLVATLNGDRGVSVTVGAVSAFAALLCIGAAGVFALDALQLRSEVKPDSAAHFNAAAAWGGAKLLLGFVVAAVLGLTALRSPRRLSRVDKRVPARNSPIVVGQSLDRPAVPANAPARDVVSPPASGRTAVE